MSHSNKTIGAIGCGVIGGGWIARFLLNGYNVKVFDPHPETERLVSTVIANAERAYARLTTLSLGKKGTLTIVKTLAHAVENTVYIQESVSEKLDLKQKLFAEIEQFASPETLIGSSTSGFKPSELNVGMTHPQRLFVAHPFNPVYLLPAVEIVPSAKTSVEAISLATQILIDIGMKPLIIRKEIDAHVADRLLEAVWREALWLIKDGVATTGEIDDIIRYGFGLRWAQMGLFETYRIAGGEAGMRHFLSQFGPALKWPWTKLVDVPEMDEDLVETISNQSDAQSGHHTIRELETIRDDNLIAILQALKAKKWGAGALLSDYEIRLTARLKTP